MFKHFLITRFNLRKSDWKTNKNNKAILTEEWHKNRFQLFTDYCFPSVAYQTNKEFNWIVFFDTSTPDEYKKVITALQNDLSIFKPIFIDGMNQFLPSIKTYIKDFDEKYIITSSLDNDDCISRTYIEEIQKEFDQQDFMVLDFVDGYTLQIQPNIKIGKKLHQYNPFISLIEKNNEPITVCDVPHRIWKKEKRILQIRDKRIWSSIIHLENKVNEFTGYGSVDLKNFLINFTLSTKQKLYIESHIITKSNWQFQSLINYISSNWKFSFKNLKKRLGFYKNK